MCHLTLACPTCHAKLFEISIMSRKSLGTELKTTTRYNRKLEGEKETLKSEHCNLTMKNGRLLQSMMENGRLSIENKNCSEHEKKLSEEVEKLKMENDILKRHNVELTEKLRAIVDEMRRLKTERDNLRLRRDAVDSKRARYRVKLKQAVEMVNDLQRIAARHAMKPDFLTQTDRKRDCSTARRTDVDSENLLLSDIFFKPAPFLDCELELFASRPNLRCKSNDIRADK